MQQSFNHDRGLIGKINELIKQLPKESGRMTQTTKESPTRSRPEEKRVEEKKDEGKKEEGRIKRAVSDHPTKNSGITINVYNEKKEKESEKDRLKEKEKERGP